MFTGLLEAAMPLCRTPEERLFFQQIILDRIVVSPSYLYHPSNEPNSSEKLIAECLERLRYEGNTHLLSAEELPQSSKSYNADWTRLSCSSGPDCGEVFIKSASGPEWGDLFIQGPKCGELFIKFATYSRC